MRWCHWRRMGLISSMKIHIHRVTEKEIYEKGSWLGQLVTEQDETVGHKKKHPVNYPMPFLTTLLTLQRVNVIFSCLCFYLLLRELLLFALLSG